LAIRAVLRSPRFARNVKPASRKNKDFWTSAFAGVKALTTFYRENILRRGGVYPLPRAGIKPAPTFSWAGATLISVMSVYEIVNILLSQVSVAAVISG
jgi:hypothetical protein